MSRHYYLTRAGRLRRKDRTLWFEPKEDAPGKNVEAESSVGENVSADSASHDFPAEIEAVPLLGLSEGEMGAVLLEPETPELQNQTAGESENEKPVRVSRSRARRTSIGAVQ